MRRIREIAVEINATWSKIGKGVNYAARPYLDAMGDLDSINDNYATVSGRSVVLYFLSNASTFRGPDAKRLKAELKGLLA